jgi:hypothetical protein
VTVSVVTAPLEHDVHELTCARCGYLLRGLEGIGRCPECGLEIDQSLAARDLSRADPRWVTQLAGGAMLLVITFALAIVRDAVYEAEVLVRQAGPLAEFCRYAALGAEWLGWWLLTTPRPGPATMIADGRGSLRWWARMTVVAAIVVRLQSMTYFFPWSWRVSHAAEDVILAVVLVLINTHLRRLARRLPDAFLIRHLPILLGVNLLALVVLRLTPDWGAVLGKPVFVRSSEIRPLAEMLMWGSTLYGGYVLFHLWRRLTAAAEAAVVHCKVHDTHDSPGT